MIDFAPDTLLTSLVYNWSDYYVSRVQNLNGWRLATN